MGRKFKIGGKLRRLEFGLVCIENYCVKMGGDIEQLDKIFKAKDLVQIKAIATLIWAAMIASCEINGDDLDFSFAQVTQWLGDMEQDVFEDIVEEFKKSRYMGHTIADYYYTPVEQDLEEAPKKTKKKKNLS